MPLIEKRTEGQINAAKRGQIARLGGLNLPKLKRKKCKRGKSCGASCIPGYHVCMVDIPWALNPAITKVANQILAQRKLPAAKTPVAKPSVTKPETKAPAAKAPGKKPKIPVYRVPGPVNKILTNMVNNLLNDNKRKNNNKNPGNK
jgi:hypothetical protein